MKSDEFFRIADVHSKEVDAGLYSLPYLEISDQFAAAKDRLYNVGVQKALIDSMYDPAMGLLGYERVSEYMTFSSLLTYLPIPKSAQTAGLLWEIDKASKGVGKYRSDMESLYWRYTGITANIGISDQTKLMSSLGTKQEYLRKDIAFRTTRATISYQLAVLQLGENTRDNSILNYSERLDSIREVFNLSLLKMCQRIVSVSKTASALYASDLTIKSPARGKILDKASIWLLNAQDKIARIRRRQKIAIFTTWLSKWGTPPGGAPSTDLIFKRGLNVVGSWSLADTQSRPALLRGVAFEYVGSGKKSFSLTVTPPAEAVAGIRADTGSVPLIFGRVLSQATGAELRPQFTELLWNGNPYGIWAVSSDEDLSNYGIEDIAMHIWAAYQ